MGFPIFTWMPIKLWIRRHAGARSTLLLEISNCKTLKECEALYNGRPMFAFSCTAFETKERHLHNVGDVCVKLLDYCLWKWFVIIS